MTVQELTQFDFDKLKESGFIDAKDVLKHFFIVDTFGNSHFYYNDVFSKIERFFTVKVFGKKESNAEV